MQVGWVVSILCACACVFFVEKSLRGANIKWSPVISTKKGNSAVQGTTTVIIVHSATAVGRFTHVYPTVGSMGNLGKDAAVSLGSVICLHVENAHISSH